MEYGGCLVTDEAEYIGERCPEFVFIDENGGSSSGEEEDDDVNMYSEYLL